MTVEEMIAVLQRLDPKLPVVYSTAHGDWTIRTVQEDIVYTGLHGDTETRVALIESDRLA